MLSTNKDITNIIFNLLPITTKRGLIRTCKLFHQLSIHMPIIESEFQQMINNKQFFYVCKFPGFYNPLYKFTIEFIFDSTTHLIPDRYVIIENRILHQYKRIYYVLGKRNDLEMIKRLFKLNRNSWSWNNVEYAMMGAAKCGNIEMLDFMLRNNRKFTTKVAAH